jgi:hypothetical protein
VIVAHSQGCLILRLALDDLIAARQPATDGIDRTGPLKDKLCVFTFGNPSVDWERDTSSEAQMLSDFVLRTEHFANEKDFVAKTRSACRVGRQGTLWNDLQEPDSGWSSIRRAIQSGQASVSREQCRFMAARMQEQIDGTDPGGKTRLIRVPTEPRSSLSRNYYGLPKISRLPSTKLPLFLFH